MDKKEFQEKISNRFRMDLKRRMELINKISEFVQENKISKQEWFEINEFLEGKE